MKKLLILMLVVGTSSLASATPIITGPSNVLPGATNTYTVSGTAAESGVGFAGAVWLDFLESYPYFPIPYCQFGPSGPISPMTAMGDAAGGNIYAYNNILFYAQSGFYNVTAGPWFTFTWTIPGGDLIGQTHSLDIMDHTLINVLSRTIVTVVPEPMTIALLGLGGLLLIRKKRS